MTAAAITATLAKRRTAYLDGIADAALADEDAKAEHDNKVAEAAKAARKHREELSLRRDKLVEDRLAALTEAENNCRAMIKAMGKVLSLGADASAVYNALGERPPPGLAGESAMRMLGEKLSAALKTITKNGARFGSLMLARTWRQATQSWTEESIAPVRRTETRSTDDV